MENIKIENLDTTKIIVPEGYKVIIDPEIVEKERKEKEIAELEELITNTPKPSDEELIEYGRMFHPYYENLRRLNKLNESI